MSKLVQAVPMPRLAHYPHCAFSSGPEFTELAASAGLVLDDWQARDLAIGLGEREDGKWAAFQVTEIVARQNGKDGIAEALGLGWLFITEERLIGHSAHQYKTAMEAFRRLVGLIENTDDLRRKVKKIINTNGEEGIELLSGARMRFLARSKGSGRGFSFDKMIWNEAYDLTAPQVDAVLPSLSARPNPQIWLMSSPPLDVASGEVLVRARKAAKAGAPGVVYLDYGADMTLDQIGPCAGQSCSHQYGAAGETCILDDKAMRAATNPAYPHRINDEAIDRERATMDPIGFARERFGVWPPDLSEGFTVISRRQWDRLEDKTLPQLIGRPVFAVAVSSRQAGPVRASIGLAQRRVDAKAHLELILSGPGSAWIPMALGQLKARHPSALVVIDPGAPEGSIIADVHAAGIETIPMTARDVAQGFGMIYDAATSDSENDHTVAHLGQAELQLAVRAADKRPVGDGHAWDAKTPADITPIVSVTKALWGLAGKGSEAEPVAPWVIYA